MKKNIFILTLLFSLNYIVASEKKSIPSTIKEHAIKTLNEFCSILGDLHNEYGINQKKIKELIYSFDDRCFDFISTNSSANFHTVLMAIRNKGIPVLIDKNLKINDLIFYEKENISLNENQKYTIISTKIPISYNNKRFDLYLNYDTRNNKIIDLTKNLPDWANVFNNDNVLVQNGNQIKIFNFHLNKANNGSLTDILSVANAYYYGRYNIKKNVLSAKNWFLRLYKKKKNLKVSYHLALIYWNLGINIREYNIKCINIIEEALNIYSPDNYVGAESNILIADLQYLLGKIYIYYYNDFYREQNIVKGVNLMFKSAEAYHPDASITIAKWLFEMIPKSKEAKPFFLKDSKKIFELLKNHKTAEMNGKIYNSFLDYNFIYDLLEPAAFTGNHKAQGLLGELLSNENYEKYNLKNALYFLEEAKEEGIYGMSKISRRYFEYGKIFYYKKNYTDAINNFKIAAEYHNEEAAYYMGDIYDNGLGVKPNITKAIYWYKKAAKLGSEDAKIALEILE